MGIRSQGGASFGEQYVPAVFRDIFGRTGVDAVAPSAPSQGINASGGVISDYAPPTAPTTYYRAHVFTNPGTFVVSDLGTTMPDTIEYLVVGGGGGGGHGQLSNEGSGGGGAGGMRTGSQTATTTTYPIDVGTGGSGGLYPADNRFSQAFTGRMSQFGSPTQTYMRSEGGGGGVGYPKGTGNSRYGGSGGGNMDGGEGGLGNRTAGNPGSPVPAQGNDGGDGETNTGGGGGGAGGAGQEAPSSGGGNGGAASLNAYAKGIDEAYAGGGGGAGYPNSGVGEGGAAGGVTVGGDAAPNSYYYNDGHFGRGTTGSGGGGAAADGSDWGEGGGGAPGRVVVRYRIDADNTNFVASSVATGGYVSYTPTNTVHTFFTPGSFVAPTSLTISFLLVGGGGGGGTDNGGGGGGGEVVVGTSYPLPAATYAITVGNGGAGGHGDYNGQARAGKAGYPSTFNSLTARGGGGGGSCAMSSGQPRMIGTGPLGQGQVGNGGGGSGVVDGEGSLNGYDAPATGSPTPTVTYYGGNNGGDGTGPSGGSFSAGGGAGAGGNGNDGGYPGGTYGNGGVGVENSILGSPFWFGGGGGGGGYYDSAPTAQTCAGGRGGGGGGAEGYSPGDRNVLGEAGADVLGNMIGYDATDISGPEAKYETTQPNRGGAGGGGCGASGSGGGGGGDIRSAGPPASPNRGGMGGAGGSGIVVISYPTP